MDFYFWLGVVAATLVFTVFAGLAYGAVRLYKAIKNDPVKGE